MKGLHQTLAVFLISAFFTSTLMAATHDVAVNDDFFSPNDLTIQAGDTVRWTNAAGGFNHDVTADNFSFQSTTAKSFIYERTFNSVAEILYHCSVHSKPGRNINNNMNGRIVVEATTSVFMINAGLNGNWWNGLDRNGEGAQIEVSDGGDGSLTFVATLYSYFQGQQIFLIAVGTASGNTAEVDVFITEGGLWGDSFDPALIKESQWGTGTFTADSCDAMDMTLIPNAKFQALGYTDLTYDLVRLTTPASPCPIGSQN